MPIFRHLTIPLLFCFLLEVRMLEKHFQSKVIKELKKMFKGCIVLKTDPTYIQGLPDLLILYKKHWAALEVKNSPKSAHRPNQDYYVNLLNKMSFASFIFPENKEEVFNELRKAFKS